MIREVSEPRGPNDAWEEIKCALVVSSSSLSPAEVTARLGVDPSIQRTKGAARSGNPRLPVVTNQWIWQPDMTDGQSMDIQLDAIWAALSPRASAFASLPPDTEVVLDIVIFHRGSHLRLGWALAARHIAAASALGAAIGVDEYDYTRG